LQSSTVVLESQPDWITAIFTGARSVRSATAKCETLMRAERVAGNRELPFRLGEYNGTRCGRVRAGERHDALLVQLSGDLAALHFDWFRSRAARLTRVDLAVTIQTAGYDSVIASDHYKQALLHRESNPRAAVPSLIMNGAGGSTFYLGKRTSDVYFRCYDKAQECVASGDPDALERYDRAWRYEIELHDETAGDVAGLLPNGPARAHWITSYVHSYLEKHGCYPIFDRDTPPVHVSGFRRRSDRESRLDWLSRSVAPTVRWLIDSTPREEIMKCLGLAEEEE